MQEWYVSYAWGDDKTPEGKAREQIVDDLCASALASGHQILRDKEVLGLGDSISRFMRRIGTGDRIFVILNDKYLRSPHCMFELSEIWRTSRHEGETFLERARIYALPETKIWDPIDWTDWAIHWKKQHDALDSRAKETARPSSASTAIAVSFRCSVSTPRFPTSSAPSPISSSPAASMI
jgi:internalin A